MPSKLNETPTSPGVPAPDQKPKDVFPSRLLAARDPPGPLPTPCPRFNQKMIATKLVQTVEGSWFVEVTDDYGNPSSHLGPFNTQEGALAMKNLFNASQ